MQQFLLPDQTPPTLEALTSLQAEPVEGSGGHTLSPEAQNKQEAGQEVRAQQRRKSEERRTMTRQEAEEEEEKERTEAAEQTEERLQPEGRQAQAILPENDRRQVGRSPGPELFSIHSGHCFRLKRFEFPVSCLRRETCGMKLEACGTSTGTVLPPVSRQSLPPEQLIHLTADLADSAAPNQLRCPTLVSSFALRRCSKTLHYYLLFIFRAFILLLQKSSKGFQLSSLRGSR